MSAAADVLKTEARLPDPDAVESPVPVTGRETVPVPVKRARSELAALAVSVADWSGNVRPEAPPKSMTPSNAATGVVIETVGRADTRSVLSGRLRLIRARRTLV